MCLHNYSEEVDCTAWWPRTHVWCIFVTGHWEYREEQLKKKKNMCSASTTVNYHSDTAFKWLGHCSLLKFIEIYNFGFFQGRRNCDHWCWPGQEMVSLDPEAQYLNDSSFSELVAKGGGMECLEDLMETSVQLPQTSLQLKTTNIKHLRASLWSSC